MSTHIDTLKSKHTKEDIYGKHDSREKVKIHTGDLLEYATCLYVKVHACGCVCSQTQECERWESLCAFWGIPYGRQKDNVTVEQGARRKQRGERMEKKGSQESWVWISLKCSIWWVIIFTKAAKSILFPKGVASTHSFLLVLPPVPFLHTVSQCLSCVCFLDELSMHAVSGNVSERSFKIYLKPFSASLINNAL